MSIRRDVGAKVDSAEDVPACFPVPSSYFQSGIQGPLESVIHLDLCQCIMRFTRIGIDGGWGMIERMEMLKLVWCIRSFEEGPAFWPKPLVDNGSTSMGQSILLISSSQGCLTSRCLRSSLAHPETPLAIARVPPNTPVRKKRRPGFFWTSC